MSLRALTDELVGAVARLRFAAPVAYVYNPLEYARAAYDRYLAHARVGCDAVLLGMNPGPWGMMQTGVPFGEVATVRDWLKIDAPIGRPPREHPRRPVQGLACPRSEVSGARLWGWARAAFGTPARFFARFFVANYCPLGFLVESGANVTPDKLPPAERDALHAACDRALSGLLACLQPRFAIGVGAYAEARLRSVTAAMEDCRIQVGAILHPSPASPAANRGWAEQATRQLADLGITFPAQRGTGPPRQPGPRKLPTRM